MKTDFILGRNLFFSLCTSEVYLTGKVGFIEVGFSKETFYLLNDYYLGDKFIIIVEKLFKKSSYFNRRGKFPLILSWSLTVIKGKTKRKLVAVRRMQAGQPFGAPTLSGNGLPAV